MQKVFASNLVPLRPNLFYASASAMSYYGKFAGRAPRIFPEHTIADNVKKLHVAKNQK